MKRLISLLLALVAFAVTGCQAADPVVPAAALRQPSRPVASFDFLYQNGRLYVIDQGRAVQFATDMTLPTQSSGSSGTTTPTADTILLHQTMPVSSSTRDTACNASPFGDTGVPSPFQGVCIPIQWISGYVSQYILNAYVQLTSLAGCGTTTTPTTYVKSESNSEIGVDNSLGLWSYGSIIYPNGDLMGRDRATRNWYFETNVPGASACFRFTAVAMGQPWTP